MRTTTCARSCALAVGAVAALVLSGCSGEDGSDGGGDAESADGTTAVTVGVLPIVPSAAMQLGIDEGIFDEHGFDVTLETGQGGAALLPAVMSQEMDFALSNPLSVMLAQEQGLDIQLVTGYSHSKAEGDDVTSVWAAPDSGIESPADLAGKTVAVNTLKTMGEVSIRDIVAQDGGDPAGVEFVEMGFPDMPAAVASGQVDAAWILEPHLTRALQDGAEAVTWNFAETDPELLIAAYFTSDQQIADDPQTVTAFTAALEKSLTYAQENPDETRAVLDSYTEIDPAVKEAMVMPRFTPELDESQVQLLADLGLEYGMFDEPVDISKLLP